MDEPQKLDVVNLSRFISLELPPKEMVISPIIPTQGLAMLYAMRGIGKTHISLGIAYAVASGSTFLEKWGAPKPRKVLFIDGEMPAQTLQERLKGIIESNERSLPDSDYLRIITPDLNRDVSLNLSSFEGQELISHHLDGVDLVIIDNLSTLCLSGKENEGEGWLPVQQWALNLRKKGISVLFIHHAGKNEQQRGTSRREDVLDTVIALKCPSDYEKNQGARFEIHYEKARGIFGEEAKPFEVQLISNESGSYWNVKSIEDVRIDQVLKLRAEGLTQRDIAQEMGIGKSTVNRILKNNQ